MEEYLKGRRHPVEVAKDILKTRFPKALCGFAAGSFQRGEATASSDIDLVIIFEKLDFAWRESFLFEDWPVEAFVHDPDTLNYFFQEVNEKDGVLSLPNMVFEGTTVLAENEFSHALKKKAQKLLMGSPTPWTEEIIYHQRYGLTDLVDDLRAPRNELEAHITVGAIHEMLGNFYFRSKNLWSASRKHIPRRLLQLDQQMGQLNLEEYIVSLASSGWLLHPVSIKTMRQSNTVYLARPGFPALIEVQQKKKLSDKDLFVTEISFPIDTKLISLTKSIGLERIIRPSTKEFQFLMGGMVVKLQDLLISH